MGLEVSEDDAGGPAEAGAGNVLARLAGRNRGWVLFCAHLDTVPHHGQIEVALSEGIFRSRGETILGADNKAAVAVFMELVSRYVPEPPPIGIELLFTVAEEQGLRGAKAFDSSVLRSSCGFVLDHASAVGEVIVSCPPAEDSGRFRRRRGARRYSPRGWKQRDRGCCGSGCADAAWAHRSRDHRQRGVDLRGYLRQRGARPLLDPGRVPQP